MEALEALVVRAPAWRLRRGAVIDHQVFGLGRVLQSSANVLTIKLSGGTDLSLNRQEHADKFMSVLARSLQEAQEYVTLAPTRPQLLQRVVLDGRSKSGESASASPDGVTFLGGTTFTLKSKASDSRSKRSKDSSQAWCPRCGLSVEKKDFKKQPPRGNPWVGERSIEAAVRGSGGTCGRLTQRIAALPLSRRGRAAARPPAVRRRRDLPPALFSEKGFRSSRE